MMIRPESGISEPTDDALMHRVALGEHDALGVLFGRHHRRVHALCYRFTGDPAAADDLVQEAFLRVLRFGKGFDSRAQFTTWLHRIVRNVSMDHLKQNEREARRRTQAALHLETERNASNDDAERVDLVRRALYRLPPDHREVLILSRYQGLKYREIADLLEITVDAVKARAHRAMRDLRLIFHELEQQA